MWMKKVMGDGAHGVRVGQFSRVGYTHTLIVRRPSNRASPIGPVLAVDSKGDLFIGGYSEVWPKLKSSIQRYSSDGRHQRSWLQFPTVFVDLDISPTDTVLALQQEFGPDDRPPYPAVADRIVHFSTRGSRLDVWTTSDALVQIAINSDGGVFVAHAPLGGRSRVEQFLPDGSRSSAFQVDGSVVGMDFGAMGDLFVAADLGGGLGQVGRYRPTTSGADQIAAWSTCDVPRDIAVAGEANVVVLVRTPARDSSISAICQYDELGDHTHSFQIPIFTGGLGPSATSVPGEINWLPIAIRRY